MADWPSIPAGQGVPLVDATTGEFQSEAVKDKLNATFAGVHGQAIDVTKAPYNADPSSSATANTTAIQTAITDAHTLGKSVFIPAGVYDVTGLTMPAQGFVSIRGEGPASTVLHNTHASNHTITVAGTGGGGATPYAERFSIEKLGFTAAALNAGQAALSVTLARDFSISDVHAAEYGVGFRIDSIWRCSWETAFALSCGVGWLFLDTAYAGSTPSTYRNCSAVSSTDYGVRIEADVDQATWIGGDITGNAVGIYVTGATSRNITFEGVNFEANAGADISVGDGTAGPSNMSFISCRFWRPSTAGTLSVDYTRGSNLTFLTCYWNNYTKAVNVSATAGVVRLFACHAVSVTTFATLGSNTIATASAIVEGSGAGFTRIGDATRFNQAQVLFAKGISTFGGPQTIGGASDTIGFYGKTPVARPAAVAVTVEAVHAALVTLGLITA